MEDIGFFFTLGNETIQLAINPPSVKVQFKGKNKQVEIIGIGEITLIKKRALAKISFETFLPGGTWFPGIRTLGVFKGPSFYKDFFERVFIQQTPIRLTITGINLSMMVTLDEFEYTHEAGEEEDPTVVFKLTEYKDYKIETMSTTTSSYNTTTTTSNGVTMVVEKMGPTVSRAPTAITVGSVVILNGKSYTASTGGKEKRMFVQTECKVNLINKAGEHVYHVTNLVGVPIGWVDETAVKLK